MRVSVWYRDEEKRPAQSGWYLAHRSFGMGGMRDGDRELGYLYYNAKKQRWQKHNYNAELYVVSVVYYWADMNTNDWISEDGPSIHIKDKLRDPHLAVQEAWQNVEDALDRYRVITELTNE